MKNANHRALRKKEGEEEGEGEERRTMKIKTKHRKNKEEGHWEIVSTVMNQT